MKSRLGSWHDPILIQLRENGRDLALAKGIVERVIENLRRDTETRGGAAVYHQARQQPLVLLIVGDIAQHQQGLELLHEPGCPFAELQVLAHGGGVADLELHGRPHRHLVADRDGAASRSPPSTPRMRKSPRSGSPLALVDHDPAVEAPMLASGSVDPGRAPSTIPAAGRPRGARPARRSHGARRG